MSRSGEQRERPRIARRIARACNSGAIPTGPLRRWPQARYHRISGDLSKPLQHILGWGAARPREAHGTLRRKPDLRITGARHAMEKLLQELTQYRTEVSTMRLEKFRVQNYKKIRDSGWITVRDLTVFVGKNESGKSALFRGLSKLNPSDGEKYDGLKEFPRRRYTDEFTREDWPVASTDFALDDSDRRELQQLCPELNLKPARFA